MEDLLEELLNVLAMPSSTGSAHKEMSSIKPFALSNGSASQKTQVDGFLVSRKITQETAYKATEKMGREMSYKADQESDQDIRYRAIDERQSALMTVASLSNLAIDRLLKAAQSSNVLADTVDISIESLLFDAGVAVPTVVGHRAFGTRDDQGSGVSPLMADEIPPEELLLETMPLEDLAPQKPDAVAQSSADELDIQGEQELEDGRAEIDEYVMNAFDIGDFEADAHAAQADTHATEHFETKGRTANESDSSDFESSTFEPDDFELDLLHLETLDLQAEDGADSGAVDLGAEDNSAERLATADVSLDELVAATEQNFLARWFKRLMGAKADEPEAAEAELSEPRLFESEDSRREVPLESTFSRDAEYDSDFYAEEVLERDLEPVLEPVLELSVDDAVNDAVPVLEPDEEADTSQNLEASQDLEASWMQELTTIVQVREDEEDEIEEATVAAAVVEPLDSPLTEKRLESDAFALDAFEADALGGFDKDGFEEDSLLEPLGEKAWLSEADKANEALHVAAATGDLSGVWAALEANASVNALWMAEKTALSTALEAGHMPVVEMLLEVCADPNLPDVVNGSPVRYPLMAALEAAEPVRGEMMHLLLASGAEVDQVDAMGRTALMGAAERGYVDAMRLLIEANANLDAQDLLGQTAMLLAKGHGCEGAIALLQASAMDRERAIAFLKAVTQGNLTAVEQWLASGISPNTRVARMSALTQAAAKGEVAIAKLLIEAGADIDYRFYETDPTPLFHAVYRGQLEMVSLLLEAGASPHPTPGYPIGALDYAEIGQQKADDAKTFEPIVALLATLATRSN